MAIGEAIPHRAEADSFQFSATLASLKRAVVARWLVVLSTTVLTTGLVAAYVWIWPPTFQATLMMSADSDKDASRTSFYSGWNAFRQQALADEGTLMTSGPVLKETILRLNLKYDDVYHPFFSYLTHLWMKSEIGNAYRRAKRWLFPKPPNPYEPTPEEIESYKVLADFREGTRVDSVKDTSIGLLTVKASSQRVAEITNTLADVYLEQRRENQIQEATQAHASLSAEIKKSEAELAELDKEISRFRSSNSLLLQYEKDKVQIGNYEGRRLAIGEMQAKIAEKEATYGSIDRGLAQEAEFINSSRVFKDTAAHDRITKLEIQLRQTRQQFQADSPEVREIEEQIRIAMNSVTTSGESVVIRNAVRVGESYEILRTRKVILASEIAGDRAALEKKKEELERERLLIEQLPEKLKINHEFERKQVVLESKLRTLYEKLSIATVSLASARSAPPALRIVEYAVPPEQPVWPRTRLFLMAAVASGLLLGTLMALLLELVFERVTYARLWERNAVYRVFAVIGQDGKFLDALYSSRSVPTANAHHER